MTGVQTCALPISLDQSLWDAVESSDLAAAKSAFSQGACADLAQVPKPENDEEVFVVPLAEAEEKGKLEGHHIAEIGRASCRERV